MTKIYALLDKKNKTLYNDYIRASKDVRELYSTFTTLVNDHNNPCVPETYPEDFCIICVADIVDDHFEKPKENGKAVDYYIVVELADLKKD